MSKIKVTRAFLRDLAHYTVEKIILRKPAAVLMYHAIDNGDDFFMVTPAEFKWQMEYLKRHAYQVVPLASIVGAVKRNEKIRPKTVAITFDDGYADNFYQAYPVLKQLQFPATIFVTTGLIKESNNLKGGELGLKMLNWEQMKEMQQSGLINFEPHTVNHPKLTQLSKQEAEQEMLNSKLTIEKELGATANIFAYPKGRFNESVLELARRHFRAAVTVKSGFINNRSRLWTLPRNAVDSLVGRLRFKLKI